MSNKIHYRAHHTIDFLILIFLLLGSIIGVFYYDHQVLSQVVVVITMAVLYVIWGILHHHHENNLTFEVALEYIAMAALIAFMLIIFLLHA